MRHTLHTRDGWLRRRLNRTVGKMRTGGVEGRYLRQYAYVRLLHHTLGEVLEQKSARRGHHTCAEKCICQIGRSNGRPPTGPQFDVLDSLAGNIPTSDW